MKSHDFVGVSSAALAAVLKLDTTVSFLSDRQETVGLSPAGRRTGAAYVWRRVFLKRRDRRS